MNSEVFEHIKSELYKVLQDRFNLKEANLEKLVQKGQEALKTNIIGHVSKEGTGELEAIITRKIDFKISRIYLSGVNSLTKELTGLDALQGNDPGVVSDVAVVTLVTALQDAFSKSGQSGDTQGICKFLGLDPMLLKVVNSPVGKMFGKLFKK